MCCPAADPVPHTNSCEAEADSVATFSNGRKSTSCCSISTLFLDGGRFQTVYLGPNNLVLFGLCITACFLQREPSPKLMLLVKTVLFQLFYL